LTELAKLEDTIKENLITVASGALKISLDKSSAFGYCRVDE